MGRFRMLAAGFAVWALLLALHALILLGFTETPPEHAFVIATGAMGSGGLLSLGLWLLLNRWSWPSRVSLGFWLKHGAAALAFASAWVSALIAMSAAFSDERILDRVARLMGWEFIAGIWLYASVAGFSHARHAAARLRERELSEVRTRLAALQARMSPHFLFNALNTVSGLIEVDPTRAADAVEQLAELLRYTMEDRATGNVTMADEWEFTRRFLDIAKLRFGERLVVSTDIEETALACRLPALTLQPLVENAVRHGIANSVDGGTITICARRRQGQLLVSVDDTGAGAAGDAGRGLGLGGLRERLRLHCGEAASLRVASDAPTGFRVELSIPCVVDR